MSLNSFFRNDRRTFLLMMAGLALAPSACAQELDAGIWQRYRQAFVREDGRVVDTGNADVSHSEGQGFGMLLALAAGDKATFEAMFAWTEKTLRTEGSGLYAWRYQPANLPPVSDPNNATDGDILIAWALLMASVKWRREDYALRSQTLRAAILREACISHAGKRVMLPGRIGFTNEPAVVLNLSYYVWPALDAFSKLEPMWNDIISDGLDILSKGGFGSWSLTTDWIQIGNDGTVAPAEGRPARFGYDAVRVPLYLAWSKRTAETAPYRRYWLETETASGWPAWIDVVTAEVAPYPASAGTRAIADLVLQREAKGDVSGRDYYSDSLLMLSKLGMKNVM